LMVVDLQKTGLTGLEVQKRLEKVGVVCSRAAIPFDPQKPYYTSGIRLGTPAVTTCGYNEADMLQIAKIVDITVNNFDKGREKAKKIADELIESKKNK
ncbi:MAG: serine hydroxymethyltransferase, partial [Defluviitaleaceae bacterium]|nr:serine hydroxymethyltransferase [Defluviitaleaceae bacterium]